MADLSPKQLVFVQEYLRHNNITAAAKAAGYSEKSAHVQGSRMLKNDKVKQYLNKNEQNLNRDLREMFVADAVKAYEVMKEIMNDPAAQHKDRLSAAKDLLDRAGYKATDKIVADVNSEGTVTVVFDAGMSP
ncbi:terminase small subunit [Paenibacillus ottowii]|uniref:Terminase small subunit n=1 Tax=Paenibacillus ottowii TaxID=2315729 RepID=A0ABY3B0V7_9BACL|nr:terminase small subunit [Paenibacillus ottowii]TQR97321.1 terminase small subunit [Paenibacillus ottowii]